MVAIDVAAPMAAYAAYAKRPAVGETVTMSRLPGFNYFQLPDDGRRLTDAARLKEMAAQLKGYAAEAGIPINETEVVAWESSGDDDSRNSQTRDMLKYTFLGAGFNYKEGSEGRFTARSTGDRRAVVGFWSMRDGYLMLTWGTTAPREISAASSSLAASTATTIAPTPIGPSRTIPPAASNSESAPGSSGSKIGVPASLIGGTWKWTTIGGVGYVNTTTGQMAEPSGMSARFTFTRDGHYTYFFFIHQRTYGMVSETTTTESGAVSFRDDGTFLLTPSRGHYRGNAASTMIDRDMTPAERKARTFYWEWRTASGKRQFYIGPGRSSLSPFTRE